LISRNRALDPDQMWWEFSAGPSLYIREVVKAISEGKNTILVAPNGLPWREKFIQLVSAAIQERDFNVIFESHYPSDESPGDYLVKQYGLNHLYRPTKTHAVFLREQKALQGRILSLSFTADEAPASQAWHTFAKEYVPSSSDYGVLMIESPQPFSGATPKNLAVFPYDSFISEHDSLVFSNLLLTGESISSEQKKYISALAVAIYAHNPEHVVHFLEDFSLASDDPLPIALAEYAPEEATRRIWDAQVQSLFPLIMKEGRAFVETWAAEIQDALDYIASPLGAHLQHDQRFKVNSPTELEVGPLRFLADVRRKDEDGHETKNYVLFLGDDAAAGRLSLLTNARNLIAHGDICPAPIVRYLLQPYA
jgi:hypothetical protein